MHMPAKSVDGVVRALVAIGALVVAGCAPELVRVVPESPSNGDATAAPSDPTFEVVARVNGARDPLRVANDEIAYTDLERALGQAVIRAVPPRHDSVLSVELVAADARYEESRISVSMVVRATLRTRVGNASIAQDQFVCRDGAFVPPPVGGRVIWSCMSRIGQDIGGWLAGLPR
jgi:hypothetical protein